MMGVAMEFYFSCPGDGVEAEIEMGEVVGLRCPQCRRGDSLPKEALEEVLLQVHGVPHLYPSADRRMTDALGRPLAFSLRIPDPTLPSLLENNPHLQLQ